MTMRISGWTVSPSNTSAALYCSEGTLYFFGITADILRCVYTKKDSAQDASPLGLHRKAGQRLVLSDHPEDNTLQICTPGVKLSVDKATGRFTWYRIDRESKKECLLLREGDKELTEKTLRIWSTEGEAPVIRREHTVDGDRNFIENLRPGDGPAAYSAKLRFFWQEDEAIHGLGQGEDGIYNYRGHVQYLYQHNMRIPMPWLLSDKGYAILADCGSLMVFRDDGEEACLELNAAQQLDYYFLSGSHAEDLIRGCRFLTGKAEMLPKWAFGYIQSKERYVTQAELVETARQYRLRGIGLDCVVQDWKTWQGERWGEKQLDPARFPDRSDMRRKLHEMHVHSMVSVWPNMNWETKDCQEMQANGYLLNDLSTYDAFDSGARKLYFKQAEEGLYRDGFDAFWCDSTEPFSGPDWGGEEKRDPADRFRIVGEEHNKYLGEERANLYALYHARGICENQTAADPEHRVLNLTRSGYPGIQQYGAVLWSGDVTATWQTLRKQLTESLNMALSAYPYWTFDAGGFFVVNKNWQGRGCGCSGDPTPKWFWKGDFEDGVRDPGYRELYVRWLQMAVFLPVMRSHGTDTPREIWHFGEPGTKYYDAIAAAISLRYRLMPYLYSLAGSVYLEDGVMERPLLMDFPEDARASSMSSEFMLGKSLLVCPVMRPMEYGPCGQKLDGSHRFKCYLPSGSDWIPAADEDGTVLAGGQEVEMEAGLQTIPYFVKAGSIIPMEEALTYAQEAADTPLLINIFPGRDASFAYYEDDGDGYAYRDGRYNRIEMKWNDAERLFAIGSAACHFPGGITGRRCRLLCAGQTKEFIYTGKEMSISF